MAYNRCPIETPPLHVRTLAIPPGKLDTPEKAIRSVSLAILAIIVRAAYAIGVLVYVAFYTSDFTTFQKGAVLLVAITLYWTVRAIIHVVLSGRRRGMFGWL